MPKFPLNTYLMRPETTLGYQRVFDWQKAYEILTARNPKSASAGLKEDWRWTAGVIWSDHRPYCHDYTFLSSDWATPVLRFGDEEIECWRKQEDCPVEDVRSLADDQQHIIRRHDRWDARTKWPFSIVPNIKKQSVTKS